MIFRKNNLFDNVKNDYDIPMDTITEDYETDIAKIKNSVFEQIGVKPKKAFPKKRMFIIPAAAVITLSAVGVVVVNGSRTVPKYPSAMTLTSDEYNELLEKHSKIPRILDVPMPSDEEKEIINRLQDEYVDLYQSAITKYTEETSWTSDEWVKKESALIKAGEDVVMSLGERTLTILKKYGFINEHTILEDFYQSDAKNLINICCDSMDTASMTTEEKMILKFFVSQIYRFVDLSADSDTAFQESVEERMELYYIPFIDGWTAHSYERDNYYITFEQESETESS